MAFTTTVYSPFLEKEAEGVVDLSSDTITAHLTNTAPTVATDALLADITEIATGGGYTQGTGLAVSVSSSALNGTDYELTLSGTIGFTATGAVAAFRYVALCLSGLAGDPLFLSLDLGVEVNMTTDHILAIDVNTLVIYTKAP